MTPTPVDGTASLFDYLHHQIAVAWNRGLTVVRFLAGREFHAILRQEFRDNERYPGPDRQDGATEYWVYGCRVDEDPSCDPRDVFVVLKPTSPPPLP